MDTITRGDRATFRGRGSIYWGPPFFKRILKAYSPQRPSAEPQPKWEENSPRRHEGHEGWKFRILKVSFVIFVTSFENTRLGMRTKRPAWVPSYPRKRVSRLIRRNKPGFPPWSFGPYSTGRE